MRLRIKYLPVPEFGGGGGGGGGGATSGVKNPPRSRPPQSPPTPPTQKLKVNIFLCLCIPKSLFHRYESNLIFLVYNIHIHYAPNTYIKS